MHVFKRFYLLFSVILSLTAPLITINFSPPLQSDVIEYASNNTIGIVGEQLATSINTDANTRAFFLTLVYLAGLLISLSLFIRNVHFLFKISNKGQLLLFNHARLILVEKEVVPHSFLNCIFVNKAAYENGLLENEILVHELAHVKQLHSLDVLFAWLVQCVFWFNPFLIFYKKAIQLNHEFLADEAAVRASNNPIIYQRLLLEKASGKKQFSLASQFNYSIIKKRLVMITKTSSPQKLFIKQLVSVFLFAAAALLFVSKETLAQVTTPQTQRKEVPSTKEGASPELMNEYEAIVARHKNIAKGNSQISEGEKNRLLEIYQRMTKEQQAQQAVVFLHKPPVKKKNPPTQAQIKEWVDAQKYFVRINGFKIKNSQLNNHRASDFDYVEIYKPNKGSTDYGKYDAQISLMTKEAYAKYVAFLKKEPPYSLAIRAKQNQPRQNKK